MGEKIEIETYARYEDEDSEDVEFYMPDLFLGDAFYKMPVDDVVRKLLDERKVEQLKVKVTIEVLED